MRITIIQLKILTDVRAASISVLVGACLLCSSALAQTINIYVRNNTDPFQAPYYIFSSTSGGASETFSLEKGSTYKFISTNTAGHPFNVGSGWRVADSELVTSSDSSSSLVAGVGSISTGQTLTVTVPASFSKSTITYYCSAHSTMVSTLAVVEGDSQAPVITLQGDNPQRVEAGTPYVEAGATADTGETVVIDSASVDTGTVGSYTVTYTATDAAGNSAVPVLRTVNVINSSFIDSDDDGYSDSDEVEWGSDPLDQSDAPIEALNWSLFAGIGQSSAVDTTAPVITLNGENPQIIEVGSEYLELGATTDTGESVVIDSSKVDTNIVGDYSVTYFATDAAGNEAISKTRTVRVGPDITPPVITLIGDNPQIIEVGSGYLELGATTDTGESVVIDSSKVDTNIVGEYSVTYSATDAAGNDAISKTRTVRVCAVTPCAVTPIEATDRISALTLIVDNIVIPNVVSLATEASAFAADGGVLQEYGSSLAPAGTGGGYYKTEADSLLAARNGWKQLMQVVQANDSHILGPAAKNKQDLRNRIHGYYLGGPSLDSFDEFSSCGTDVLVVKANEGSREVADSNINTRGMIALEYLLFNEDLSHSCGSGVSAVSGWNALSDSARKSQRYDLALKIAQDIALNAGKIRDEWSSYRTEFLDAGEVGTNFQLLTDSLFYFEKYSKSAKLAAVIGQDRLCVEDLCPKFIESQYSETSLSNIKANAEQFLAIFDSGLDNLADERESSFSALFKGLISDVVNKITELENSGTPLSLKAHVAAIQTDGTVDACGNAFANPDSEGDPQICTLAGKMKKVTDKLKIEFVTYLGVSLPEAAQGDTD
jgi:hypothetical protein